MIAIHFFPRSSLAPFFAGSKRYEEALAAYDHALHLSPQDAQVYANKGISLAELGRYEEAVQVYDEALHLEPNDPDTYEKKGGHCWRCIPISRHDDQRERRNNFVHAANIGETINDPFLLAKR